MSFITFDNLLFRNGRQLTTRWNDLYLYHSPGWGQKFLKCDDEPQLNQGLGKLGLPVFCVFGLKL